MDLNGSSVNTGNCGACCYHIVNVDTRLIRAEPLERKFIMGVEERKPDFEYSQKKDDPEPKPTKEEDKKPSPGDSVRFTFADQKPPTNNQQKAPPANPAPTPTPPPAPTADPNTSKAPGF